MHSPSPFAPPTCSKAVQWAKIDKVLPLLPLEELKKIERAVCIFYCFTRALNLTMTVAMSDLTAAQTKGDEETMDPLIHLLNNAATS